MNQFYGITKHLLLEVQQDFTYCIEKEDLVLNFSTGDRILVRLEEQWHGEVKSFYKENEINLNILMSCCDVKSSSLDALKVNMRSHLLSWLKDILDEPIEKIKKIILFFENDKTQIFGFTYMEIIHSIHSVYALTNPSYVDKFTFKDVFQMEEYDYEFLELPEFKNLKIKEKYQNKLQ